MFVFYLLYACIKSFWFGYFDRYVITPYNEYPPLLGLLLKLLNGELAWSTRREVLKVFRFKLTLVSAVMFFLMLILCWVPLGSWHYGRLGSPWA